MDGHVRDAEPLGETADAGAAIAPDGPQMSDWGYLDGTFGRMAWDVGP